MSTARIKPCRQITAQPTLPDANGYTWIYDSTNLDKCFNKTSTALGKTASLPAPGPNRGDAINTRILLTVSSTDQNVAVVLYRLDGAGAWKLHNSIAVVAGDSPQGIEWNVMSPDCLVGVLAGATPPSALTSTFLILERP